MDDKQIDYRFREAMRAIVRDLARTFEGLYPCKCADLPGVPTATGHRDQCPVDTATREDLARSGIV
jgi:hypothetical protein